MVLPYAEVPLLILIRCQTVEEGVKHAQPRGGHTEVPDGDERPGATVRAFLLLFFC